jgi:hypothetical protein
VTEQRRIDLVQVSAGDGLVSLPWASRQELLAEVPRLDSMRPTRKAFESAGTSRPVELTLEQKAGLLGIIGYWEAHGHEGLPEGIGELRSAMVHDLADAASSAD